MIKIKETKKCDTRTNPTGFTKADVDRETDLHIEAVNKCGEFICEKISTQFADHDFTKNSNATYLEQFYQALKTNFKDSKFKELDWWENHINKERHHLNDRCPNDANLIDVIEMICDCVSAGLARTGKLYDFKISDEILQKAVKNTVELLKDNIEVEK